MRNFISLLDIDTLRVSINLLTTILLKYYNHYKKENEYTCTLRLDRLLIIRPVPNALKILAQDRLHYKVQESTQSRKSLCVLITIYVDFCICIKRISDIVKTHLLVEYK